MCRRAISWKWAPSSALSFHSAGFTARFTPTEPRPNFPLPQTEGIAAVAAASTTATGVWTLDMRRGRVQECDFTHSLLSASAICPFSRPIDRLRRSDLQICHLRYRSRPIYAQIAERMPLTAVILRFRVGDGGLVVRHVGGLVVDGRVVPSAGSVVGKHTVRGECRQRRSDSVSRRDQHVGPTAAVSLSRSLLGGSLWGRCSCCAVSQVTAVGARTFLLPPRRPRQPLRSPSEADARLP